MRQPQRREQPLSTSRVLTVTADITERTIVIVWLAKRCGLSAALMGLSTTPALVSVDLSSWSR